VRLEENLVAGPYQVPDAIRGKPNPPLIILDFPDASDAHFSHLETHEEKDYKGGEKGGFSGGNEKNRGA
jgi:hypothetical protein